MGTYGSQATSLTLWSRDLTKTWPDGCFGSLRHFTSLSFPRLWRLQRSIAIGQNSSSLTLHVELRWSESLTKCYFWKKKNELTWVFLKPPLFECFRRSVSFLLFIPRRVGKRTRGGWRGDCEGNLTGQRESELFFEMSLIMSPTVTWKFYCFNRSKFSLIFCWSGQTDNWKIHFKMVLSFQNSS